MTQQSDLEVDLVDLLGWVGDLQDPTTTVGGRDDEGVVLLRIDSNRSAGDAPVRGRQSRRLALAHPHMAVPQPRAGAC